MGMSAVRMSPVFLAWMGCTPSVVEKKRPNSKQTKKKTFFCQKMFDFAFFVVLLRLKTTKKTSGSTIYPSENVKSKVQGRIIGRFALAKRG